MVFSENHTHGKWQHLGLNTFVRSDWIPNSCGKMPSLQVLLVDKQNYLAIIAIFSSTHNTSCFPNRFLSSELATTVVCTWMLNCFLLQYKFLTVGFKVQKAPWWVKLELNNPKIIIAWGKEEQFPACKNHLSSGK